MFQRAQDLIHHVSDRVKTTMQVVADIAESLGVPPTVTSLLQRQQPSWEPPQGADEVKSAPVAASKPAGDKPVAEATAKAAPAAAKEVAAKEVAVKKDAPAPKAKVSKAAEPSPKAASPKAASPKAASPKAASPKAATPNAATPNAAAAKTKAAEPKAKAASGKASKKRRSNNKRAIEGNRAKSSKVRALHVDDAINGSTYLARIIWSLGVANLEGLGSLRPADIARMVMSRSPVSLEPPNVARYIRRSKPTCIAIGHMEGSSSFYKLNAEGRKVFDDTFVKG